MDRYFDLSFYGVVADGGKRDQSYGIEAAVREVLSRTEKTDRNMWGNGPKIKLPAGKIMFRKPGILTSGWNEGGITEGLWFDGAGLGQTELIYENEDEDVANSYAASTDRLSRLTFSDMTITTRNGKRFLNHHGDHGGGGAWLYHDKVSITGDFECYCDITGDRLGSETIWRDVVGNVGAASGVFFRMANKHSVNHNFYSTTLGSAAPQAVLFDMQAGGNVRYNDGYMSLGDDMTVIRCKPPAAGLIGSGNRDFTFGGTKFESIGDGTGGVTTGRVTMLDATRDINLTFQNANLAAIKNEGNHPTFNMIMDEQATIWLNFNQSLVKDTNKIAAKGNVIVTFDGCSETGNLSAHIISAEMIEDGVRASPQIRMRGSKSADILDQDWFPLTRDQGGDHPQPIYQSLTLTEKVMVVAGGATGADQGLKAGRGNAWDQVSRKLPIGSVLTEISVTLDSSTDWPETERVYQVTNYDGSKVYIDDIRWTPLEGPMVIRDAMLPLTIRNEENRAIVVRGKVDRGSNGSCGDYGYALVGYL